jgi:hypothetical protein
MSAARALNGGGSAITIRSTAFFSAAFKIPSAAFTVG